MIVNFENSQWDNDYLVGGFNPSEKYDFVSWDDEIPNIWTIIHSCSKPRTSYHYTGLILL